MESKNTQSVHEDFTLKKSYLNKFNIKDLDEKKMIEENELFPEFSLY